MLVVTGANGFLGAYVVCTLLKKGHTVKALKRSGSELMEFDTIASNELGSEKPDLFKRLIWENADITDVFSLDKAFEGAEMVFHCAARISFKGDASELMQVNAIGTANVVNACLGAGVRKLIYASSTAALGRTDNKNEISEETQWVDDKNNTVYAESKHLAELEVWRGIEEGLPAVIVNPGIILGAGNWKKNSCRLFDNIFNGLNFYTKGVNGFVGVNDVAETMEKLAFSNIINQRFVLVSENKTYQEIFEMMAASFGKPSPKFELKPSYIPWILWAIKLNNWFNPRTSLSPETIKTSVKLHPYDNRKIKALNFRLKPINEVIKEACAAYLKGKSFV